MTMNNQFCFLNSEPCNMFIEKQAHNEPIGGCFDKRIFFEQVAYYYYIPLIREHLPKGNNLFFDFTIKTLDGYGLAITMNDTMERNVLKAAFNNNNTYEMMLYKIYDELEPPEGTAKFRMRPNYSNTDSRELATFFKTKIPALNFEEPSIAKAVCDEMLKRYNSKKLF